MADVDIDVDINTDDAINDIRRLNSAVDSFDDRIRQADNTTKKFERRLGGSFRQALQDVRVLLGAVGIGIFLRELVQVNTAFEQVRTTLVAASSSMDIVASDFAFIRAEAVRLGMPVAQVGAEFARLAAATRGTSLEGGPAREIYSSLAEAFVATGQSADEFRLAVLAVNQMVSKGRVQAEELRGQLGERLPGAYQAAARAAKVAGITINGTTAELSKALEMGQVTAEKLLPALAIELRNTFGPAFEAAKNSPKFIMGQFQVAIESLLYTLSNQGFMREFLGMLRDISEYLATDEGARGAERLGSALGFMMAQVRAAANIIVHNIDTIVASLLGLGSAAVIMGVKSLVGLLGTLLRTTGMLAMLLTPWGLLAAAVGAAVFAVAKYGDSLITLGGHTARLGDWFKAVWEVPSERIKEFMPRLRDMIVQVPLLGDAFLAAETGLAVFRDTLAGSGSFSEAFKATWDAVKASLASGLGPEVWGQVTAFFGMIKSAVDGAKPIIDQLFNGLIIGAQIAWIYVQEFGKMFLDIFMDIGISVYNIAMDIYSTFSDVIGLVLKLFGGIDPADAFTAFMGVAAIVADVIIGTFLTIIDTVEFVIDFVGRIFQLLLPILEPIAKAIGAVFGKIAEYVAAIFKVDADVSAYDTLKKALDGIANVAGDVVAFVGGVLYAVSSVVGQVLSVVFDVVGGIYSVVESVVGAIFSIIGNIFSFVFDVFGAIFGLFDLFGNTAVDTAEVSAAATTQGAKEGSNAWIRAGDIIIGVFISLIEIIGGVIKQLTNLVQAVTEVGRRFFDFFGALAQGFRAMVERNADDAAAAGERFKNIFTKPIEVGFATDWQSLTGGFGDNFGVISGAVEFGGGLDASFDSFRADLSNNFGRVGDAATAAQDRALGPNSEVNAAAGRNGAALAAAYFNGMADEIANRASTLTNAATAEQKALEAAQNKAAADAARAFAEREAGINRGGDGQPANARGGGRTGGRQSPGDRAQDRIKELAVEIMMNKQLTDSLTNQNLTREQMEGTIKATEALRRAGYDMTYQEAIAAGGLAGQLAALAYEAEVTERKLNDVKKAVESLGEINTENTMLETQLRAAQNLAVNREEYGYQLEAMNELQKNNINLTYEEAIAAGGLAEKLAQAAYARAKNKDDIADANAVASAIEGYQRETQALEGWIVAVNRGSQATIRYRAEVAAQDAVLAANGDALWESYAALDANEKKLYDFAYAAAMMATSGQSFEELSMDVQTAFNDMFNPIANVRMEIQTWSDASTASLTAMYDSIVNKTPEITAAYQELMRKINVITEVEMARNSDSLTDRFRAWVVDTGAQVEDWAGNISGIFNNAFEGMADVLTDFVMTGKFEWRDFALSVIAEITKMMIKWMIFMAIKAAANLFGIPMFEDGGIMSSSGPVNTYAKGGIATSPQMAIFGEGSKPEAFVPLPDGRTIPVTLAGMDKMAPTQNIFNTMVSLDVTDILAQMAMTDRMYEPRVEGFNQADQRRSDMVYNSDNRASGDVVIHTEVNYQGSPSGGGGGAPGDMDAQRKMMQSMAKEISQMVKVQVVQVVRDESRPGGQFNKLGRGSGF